ncbi:uncharacterized protein APUU_70090S [Aspergillus puulaauensis]|uniref:Uncharacterized protein n=1 Tax=Aspergillus puulaauensis TaxID=1220207 RepID=A0A7R7XVL6_9EURO|nr:uncharacterized protein APUU_70090S [Aspergillus puulaauensis]BCS28520.1 hypothetical protein APUU_70090S [Aspergillus puulaauensis]
MKITAASVSVLLAAITPAVVGQWLPTGTLAVITFATPNLVRVDVPGLETCEPSPFEKPFDAAIIGINNKVPHVKCTFYAEEECGGPQYTLKEGVHELRRPLVVGSFKCAATAE